MLQISNCKEDITMINNDLCASCNKVTVCRINDVLYKFHEDAKKDLGVEITMENCENFEDATRNAIVEEY